MTMPKGKNLISVEHLRGEAPKTSWILLLNRSSAKLFEHQAGAKTLSSVGGYVNPEGGMQNHELNTDRPGRVHRLSVGAGRHPAQPSEDAHEHALSVFANEMAKLLEKGLAAGDCDQIILVAEPHCLGKIKGALHGQGKKHLAATVNGEDSGGFRDTHFLRCADGIWSC